MHQWIREQFHTSVIAHEMGHSMGLRHNFTGSFDALNYHTEYWQLRTRNGAGALLRLSRARSTRRRRTPTAPTAWARAGSTRSPTRRPMTSIWKWGSTTVMDYPGDQTQDMNDIGHYDKAAMRFGYANVVDVETNMKYRQPAARRPARGVDYLRRARRVRRHLGHVDRRQPLQHVRGQVRAPRRRAAPRPGWNGDPDRPARAAVHRARASTTWPSAT